MVESKKPLLEIRDIRKSFSGVMVLNSVNLNLYEHEVLALMGENGAGKSTLMNILSGNLKRDSGQVLINGEPVDIETPKDAAEHGIAIIHQELNVVPSMTVAENLALGNEPKNRYGLIDKKRMRQDALDKLSPIKASIDPGQMLGELGVGEQQMVEIAKALAQHARILILDEPTASLSKGESEQLFRLIQELCEQGTGLIYISHRMEEVFALADRLTVLRDGHTVMTKDIAHADQNEIVAKMVGRTVEKLYEHPAREVGAEELIVQDLRLESDGPAVSFTVHAGEVVGMSGLVGAGRTEIARAIIGADPHASGTIRLKGKEFRFKSPKEAIGHGVAYLPESRKTQSIFPVRSVEDNISISSLDQYLTPLRLIAKGKLRSDVVASMESVNILKRLQHTPITNLSGGNQQKAIFARWLLKDSELLILDEPTRGVDVGAKQEIYELINDLAAKGKAVLVISSDLPEVLGISDRILVVRQGAIAACLSSQEATEESVMSYATGVAASQTADSMASGTN
ncbi:D-xylose ABC transporter ATP-binding protein [Bifidobacterium aemilianum]|uniref:D-xylose ABC transporter ATP-binding protein n=1 Tax=Bifidobacterium aemilianum TaxID=2493120 RepID=A0A366K7G4_9BIFI|nr:sugar ABC transporter ATP-binding protein [Bifidobacterium aemilianum]RBP97604.1 D-xylose ABC transporter ATP-binding protein [Bifidobacterium aemilianum]